MLRKGAGAAAGKMPHGAEGDGDAASTRHCLAFDHITLSTRNAVLPGIARCTVHHQCRARREEHGLDARSTLEVALEVHDDWRAETHGHEAVVESRVGVHVGSNALPR